MGLPNPLGATGWPIYCTDTFCWDDLNQRDEVLTAIVGENNATWVKGNHVLQFGGNLRWEQNNVRELQQAQGCHSSNGAWSALYDPSMSNNWKSFTGDGFADMLMGLGDLFSAYMRSGYCYLRQRETGLYFDDKWKLSPRLTINLGVRWDNWTPYSEKRNRLTGIDDRTVFDKFEVITPGSTKMEDLPDLPAGALTSWKARGLTWTDADSVGYPTRLFSEDNNNFGPRIGFSYQFGNRTVVRGSYGEYFWTMPLSMMANLLGSQPPLVLRFRTLLVDKGETGLYPLINAPVAGDDFFEDIVIDTEGLYSLDPSARGAVYWDGRNWKDSHTRTWHLTLEHELMRNTALRFSYTGVQGRDMEQNFSINSRLGEYNYVSRTGEAVPGGDNAKDQLLRPNPDWVLKGVNRTGYSNTHTGQIERRFSEGVGFQLFYVFTRSLTSSDANGFEPITKFNPNVVNVSSGSNRVPEHANLFQYPNELGYSYFTSPPSYDELLKMTYFNSANIPPHRVRFNGIVDLPFGNGKRFGTNVSGAVDQLIGGWQVAFIGGWRSGFWRSADLPYLWKWNVADPSLSKDERIELSIGNQRRRVHFRGYFSAENATDIDGGREALEALVPQDKSKRAVRPAGEDLDNRLLLQLADGRPQSVSITDLYNPMPSNFYQGTGARGLDLALFKHFEITEDLRLRFTADFFNVFNHPNDIDPHPQGGLVNLGVQTNEPRTIQLSPRLNW